MELEAIKKLPALEQKKALGELKKNFESERELLKLKIIDLEKLRKQKEGVAKGLATAEKRETLAEVSLIVGSVKNIKSEIEGRNRELLFLEKAIKQAEGLLKLSEEDIEKRKKKEDEIDLLLHNLEKETLQRGRTQRRDITDLFSQKKDDKTLEETVEEEGVVRKKKDDTDVKKYTGVRDLAGIRDPALEQKERAYIHAQNASTDTLEQSRKSYTGRQDQADSKVRNDYQTRAHDAESEYMTKRQQEEQRKHGLAENELHRTEEFIREKQLRHERKLYER